MGEHDDRAPADVVELKFSRTVRTGSKVERIERYWNQVRGARLVPTRADIAPQGLSGVLPNAFILERIATGLARFRIAGSHLGDLMGVDVRGMPVSAMFAPDHRQTLADAMEAAFDDPSVIRFRVGVETGFGRPAMEGDMVLLPLRSDLGEVSRILGGLCLAGDVGRAPRRLTVLDQNRTGLVGLGGADANPLRGFADDAAGRDQDRPGGRPTAHATPPAPRARRPIPRPTSLRLVVDNEHAD